MVLLLLLLARAGWLAWQAALSLTSPSSSSGTTNASSSSSSQLSTLRSQALTLTALVLSSSTARLHVQQAESLVGALLDLFNSSSSRWDHQPPPPDNPHRLTD